MTVYNLFKTYEELVNGKHSEKPIKLFRAIDRLNKTKQQLNRKVSLKELASVKSLENDTVEYNAHVYNLFKKVVQADVILDLLSVIIFPVLLISLVSNSFNLVHKYFPDYFYWTFFAAGFSLLSLFVVYRKDELSEICKKHFHYDNMLKIETFNCYAALINMFILILRAANTDLDVDMLNQAISGLIYWSSLEIVKRLVPFLAGFGLASTIGVLTNAQIPKVKQAVKVLTLDNNKYVSDIAYNDHVVMKERPRKTANYNHFSNVINMNECKAKKQKVENNYGVKRRQRI